MDTAAAIAKVRASGIECVVQERTENCHLHGGEDGVLLLLWWLFFSQGVREGPKIQISVTLNP